ncbi:hypothetical protein QBC35DRAFT_28965 [Podospora australis]|uniref:FAD-binding PCMH-type domain-containing protein n=1 Tax=Podospora australis TaxID=1536484 RepID=A0AAN6WND1_9PEZI|nr:hypothetical protein QBC35DRAFT_28965 [Podospora australis]
MPSAKPETMSRTAASGSQQKPEDDLDKSAAEVSSLLSTRSSLSPSSTGSQTSKIWISSLVTMVAVALLAVAWNLLFIRPTESSNLSCRAAKICTELRSLLGPSVITLPSDSQQYDDLRDDNWSHTAWQRPDCIASPAHTADVSSLVRTLTKANVPFAIRSGGHSPNPLDASINRGVLISLHKLKTVKYDAKAKHVSIGTGARWGEVYSVLDPYNVTVVGGRVVDVGVGGLTLGSGLSYLSDLYGLVCDNVVSFEVVLADGRIVEATPDKYSDLFWALKGGTNNFGIVTKFKTVGYPISLSWGGIQVFSPDQAPALMEALYEYQTAPNKDLYANLVINLIPTNGTMLLTLVYLKPVERPPAFAPFYKLTPVFEQTAIMPLHTLMSMFPAATQPRWTWYVHSILPNKKLYAQISEKIFAAASSPEVATIAGLQAGTLVAAVQPVSANAILAGRKKNGGNALGLQAVNQTWFSISGAWWNEADDAAVEGAVRSIHAKIGAAATSAGTKLDYLFMNDANSRQKVIASYGPENVRKLKQISKRYDPLQVFQRLVPGGQKLPV